MKREAQEKDNPKIYSHSRLWLFENCPEAFKVKYIDKAFPDVPASVEAFLGSTVHSSLEWLYNQDIAGEKVELDDLILQFVNYWNNERHENGLRISNGYDEKHYFNKGIKYLVDYFQRNKPFDDGTIEVEKRILFPLDTEGKYKIQGYIDRIVKSVDGTYEVHDYKTNEVMKSQKQVDGDRQLAFYHLGLQELFGKQIRVKLIWHFLAHNTSIVSRRSEIELRDLRNQTLKLISKIETNKVWSPCGKKWCDWCSFKKANGLHNFVGDWKNTKLKI